MTRQEMFDKAVRGLRSQYWEQSLHRQVALACVYDDGNGRHCAWGWIDEGSWPFESIPICRLKVQGDYDGVAKGLSQSDLNWAAMLQVVHDSFSGTDMEEQLRKFAIKHSLTFPEE